MPLHGSRPGLVTDRFRRGSRWESWPAWTRTQRTDCPPAGLMNQIKVSIRVIPVRRSRSVGSHDVSCHDHEIRRGKRTLIAEPAARTIDGQRPPVIDQPAKERQLFAAQESVASGSLCPRILLRSHITTKPRSHSGTHGSLPGDSCPCPRQSYVVLDTNYRLAGSVDLLPCRERGHTWGGRWSLARYLAPFPQIDISRCSHPSWEAQSPGNAVGCRPRRLLVPSCPPAPPR